MWNQSVNQRSLGGIRCSWCCSFVYLLWSRWVVEPASPKRPWLFQPNFRELLFLFRVLFLSWLRSSINRSVWPHTLVPQSSPNKEYCHWNSSKHRCLHGFLLLCVCVFMGFMAPITAMALFVRSQDSLLPVSARRVHVAFSTFRFKGNGKSCPEERHPESIAHLAGIDPSLWWTSSRLYPLSYSSARFSLSTSDVSMEFGTNDCVKCNVTESRGKRQAI